TDEIEVDVLFRNHQWMVQDEPRGRFVVQVNEDDPDDTEGSYWMRVEDLTRNGESSMIQHVCMKRWVDIDAFQDAVRAAFMLFGVRPDYDVFAEFREARRVRALHRQNEPGIPGLYRPSELHAEVIALFGNGEDVA